MSTASPSNPLAENLSVEGEESIMVIDFEANCVAKCGGGDWTKLHGPLATPVGRLMMPRSVLDQAFADINEFAVSHLKQLADSHAREQQKLHPQRDPSGQVGQRGPDDRGIDGTDSR